ncbi:hypothetical protein DDK22_14615 [Cupriavidus necator]|uniref:Uncharacterized protein n=1 Tax=Cupriavidus necator TaxID=106590 RepID=A0A367PIW5_CUPNE|nr:hypothetical protein DDK22_14615 [Cupriavidus necator]
MLGPVSGIAQWARMAWAMAWPLTAGEAVCFAEQAGRLYPVVRQFGVVAEGPRRRLLFARESALVRTPGYRDARTPRGLL